MRVQPRPVAPRLGRGALPVLPAGADAVRAIAQSGLYPANCRLIDAARGAPDLAGDGSARSARARVRVRRPRRRAVDGARARAVPRARRDWERARGAGRRGRAAGAWREAFLRAPYLRDTLVASGVCPETFETAITWDRFPAFHEAVMGAARGCRREVCGGGSVTFRFTHVYPDGPAPYFTMLAPARRGERARAVAEIKAAASEARDRRRRHDHPPPRGRPRPPALVRPPAPRAVRRRARRRKAAVDPTWALNPGVLIDRPG